jgi:hypothetical protein
LGQLFRAWHGPADDPLRLVIENGHLFARAEAGAFYSTAGTPVEPGRWMHLAATKEGEHLSLYVDGVLRGTARVPPVIHSLSSRFAMGGNPLPDTEPLRARFARHRLLARALDAESIARLARDKPRDPPPPAPAAPPSEDLAALRPVPPTLALLSGAQFLIRGPLGERIDANVRNWLPAAPAANPSLLQMFRDRDRTPRRDLLGSRGQRLSARPSPGRRKVGYRQGLGDS